MHHAYKIDQLIEGHESILYEKQLEIQSLADDLEILLEQYIGKKISVKDYNGTKNMIHRDRRYHHHANGSGEKITGTILHLDPLKRNELIVMWHHDASSTNIKISSLGDYEIEK